MGEPEQEPQKGNEPTEKSGGLKVALVSAVFTLIGGIIGVLGKGCYDLAIERQKSSSELALEQKKVEAELNLETKKFEENQKLERQKLDADLIKLALQSSGTDKEGETKRGETLGFMVDTNLISDPKIRDGVKAYLGAKKPIPYLTDTRATDYVQKLLQEYGVSDEQLARKRADTIEGITGEPGEVIKITEGSPWVANYPSGTYFHNKFQVKNRKGAVESSEVFNAENPQNRESIKQQFIQELERAGWQRLDEDHMRWNGP